MVGTNPNCLNYSHRSWDILQSVLVVSAKCNLKNSYHTSTLATKNTTKKLHSGWFSQISSNNKIRLGTTSFRYLYSFIIKVHTNYNSFNKLTKYSSLEIDIFDLKMMVKSGLEFFILKFTEPLQSCCCPVQKNLPSRYL